MGSNFIKTDALCLSIDWASTVQAVGDNLQFQFISSGSCPGYSFQITNWRLRATPLHPQDHEVELSKYVLAEVRRGIGADVYDQLEKRRDARISEIISDNIRHRHDPLMRQIEWVKARVIEEVQPEIQKELCQFLILPQIAVLFIPLFSLCVRDNLLYEVECASWPSSEPPYSLFHLAATGFAGKAAYGILAQPKQSKDYWVTTRFVRGEVRFNGDRDAALRKEFPIESISSWMGDLKKEIIKSVLLDIKNGVAGQAMLAPNGTDEHERGNRYTRAEFIKIAQARHKDLAKIWQAKAADDEIAFQAATFWVTLQSWKKVGQKIRKPNGEHYSPEGARRAAQRFYEVVAGHGKITSEESLRDYYTREGRYAQRNHADTLRGEVDDQLTQS